MALQTSADSPAPLRQVSTLIGEYVGRLGAIWVEAEVASLTRRQGVCFLTLRDLRAQLSMAATCHVSILDAGPAPITEGARVVIHAKPTYYPPSGRLQLEIREIRPQGAGELLAQLERRKQLLAAEGLFDPRLKKRLPFLPRAVGLVTARGSAAERDVLENTRARWPAVQILTRYAVMQGSGSASEVVNAVRALEVGGEVDVIVVARGGGSVEDLLPFSDEALIRAVHACTVPVVSAIGHEQDTPLLDLVADVRASTPTGAAEAIVPDVREESMRVTAARDQARLAVQRMLTQQAHLLEQLRSRPVLTNPGSMIDGHQQVVVDMRSRARRELSHRLRREHDLVGSHLARVRSLSPLATLERGYAVAQRPDGTVITRLEQVPDAFAVRLSDGSVAVRTESTEEIPHA